MTSSSEEVVFVSPHEYLKEILEDWRPLEHVCVSHVVPDGSQNQEQGEDKGADNES